MEMTELMEVAAYCQKTYSENCASENDCNYLKTMYVAIMDDDTVKVSYTPHVLRNAVKCILVHSMSKLAYSNWYTWYFVQYIDEDCAVHDNMLDNNFKLCVVASGSYSNQTMELRNNSNTIYWCKEPFDIKIAEIWELYLECKKLNTDKEISLFSEAFRKGVEITRLKKEIEEHKFIDSINNDKIHKYESLLNDMKEIVEKSNLISK